ncbi:hypothetical protein LCGC14_1517050 [marine sediment metagenome]|uniref:Uncharacterized protein n=1 Tax=marine sediment metagenome TaxID=412755 RepID=A0A0F9JKJ1_9ZZZZ
MGKLKKRDFDKILAVTTPGEDTDSGRISDAVFKRFGVRYTRREIGLAITWNLNTSFKKHRADSTQVWTFTRL